ncbi:MAG: NYN domain-containing protein [Erysipelotrichaceae bacterium]|nr:NYN domain-containing protein [Erysipelotrichaceae bacterium]
MKITIGALAHVDAGKTTLSESILYKTNTIRHKGRVDHNDSFLDFYKLEKEKGITIYNKQAIFSYKNKDYIYVDTPGHSDLVYETNRAISILDCAILIVSAIEQIPIDTIKQFNNLLNYNIPIIIFVNKMDITSISKNEILERIKNNLSQDCIEHKDFIEHVSLSSDDLLNTYIETNSIPHNIAINSLRNNIAIPVFFGSALKDENIDELLDFIDEYVETNYDKNKELNAYIYKISENYSYLKVLSGTLLNKSSFNQNKINEIYEVNGENYIPVNYAKAGDIVAVKGLKEIPIATYLPSFNSERLYDAPSLTYRIISNLEINELYKKLQNIINEFPELKINIDSHDVFINLNGELHATIVKNLIKERLNIDVSFSDPIIKYKETISDSVYGIGHFEPLRHYGEAIVKLKPYEKGIKITSLVNNQYAKSLVSYLRNYTIRGILTNSPLTNIEIQIIDIKTHPKHTEGGDLLQATRRAIRQGLCKIESILLEPYYVTTIGANADSLNTIISSLTNYKCIYTMQDNNIITKIPLRIFNDVLLNLKSRLSGNISYNIEEIAYDKCENSDEVLAGSHYDYRVDMKNPVGSIFCKQGAGHYVEPEEVESMMHLNMADYIENIDVESTKHNKTTINEDELKRVWNSIYKEKPRYVEKKKKEQEDKPYEIKPQKPLIYIIDGYNLMYYLDEELALTDLINAREKTINIVCDFAGYVAAETILVFDAYKANGSKPEVLEHDNITIVYTKENQTADTYIEDKSKELKNDYKVIVVTSDALEQLKAFSNDSAIISSREFMLRYDNFKKNNKFIANRINYKPFAELKKLLEEEN